MKSKRLKKNRYRLLLSGMSIMEISGERILSNYVGVNVIPDIEIILILFPL